MPTTVVVLHDARDGWLAHRIAKDLCARGVSARADIGVMKGTRSPEPPVSDGVLTASVLFVLVTPHSVRTPLLSASGTVDTWRTIAGGRRIIVGCLNVERVPLRLSDAVTVDFTDYADGLDTLAGLL